MSDPIHIAIVVVVRGFDYRQCSTIGKRGLDCDFAGRDDYIRAGGQEHADHVLAAD